jgi:hypothetical protein
MIVQDFVSSFFVFNKTNIKLKLGEVSERRNNVWFLKNGVSFDFLLQFVNVTNI